MSDFSEELLDRAGEADIGLSSSAVDRLEAHFRLLVKWNKVLNLTRVSELNQAVVRHYCEGLFLSKQLERLPGLGKGTVVIDAGSGGGFPGVPIAATRPEFRILLVESHHRKAAFLAEATRGWGNVRVIPKRLEEVDTPADLLVSRAVAWRDLRDAALSQAGGVGLISSSKDAALVRTEPGMSWLDPVEVPWKTDSVIQLGVRPH